MFDDPSTLPSLEDVRLFCAVVELKGFSAAADRHATTQSRVSRAVARLEDRVGLSLVSRNSRRVSPTPEGTRYAEYWRRVLIDAHRLESELLNEGIQGRLRISIPPAVGRRVLLPHLGSFCREHRELRLDVSLQAERVDMIAGDVDVAVRFAPLAETWRRRRKLLTGAYHVYGAPDVVAELRGSKSAGFDPNGLGNARCLVLNATRLRDRWPLQDGDSLRWLPVTPSIICDDVEALLQLAVEGVGITMLPSFLVKREVAAGSLVKITDDDDAAEAMVFAVTEAQSPPRRTAALIDHLARHLGPDGSTCSVAESSEGRA